MRPIKKNIKNSTVKRNRGNLKIPNSFRQNEAIVQSVLDTVIDAIVAVDERGIIQLFNAAAEQIFGYRAGEIIGKKINLLMPEPYRSEHDAYMKNYYRTKKAKIIGIGREIVAQKKNGVIFPIYLGVSETWVGKQRIFTGVIRDITEKKNLEKMILEVTRKEQQRIGEELHEGLGQHLTLTALTAKRVEKNIPSSSKIRPDAKKVVEMVNQAITQARELAQGLYSLDMPSEALVSSIREFAEYTERDTSIRCVFEYSPEVQISDNTQATHLYRILREAVNNAIKHGKAKKISIRLFKRGGSGILQIENDGAKFKPPQGKDTGMGLRIMRSRADIIKAVLNIGSRPGGGTVVTCRFSKRS